MMMMIIIIIKPMINSVGDQALKFSRQRRVLQEQSKVKIIKRLNE